MTSHGAKGVEEVPRVGVGLWGMFDGYQQWMCLIAGSLGLDD